MCQQHVFGLKISVNDVSIVNVGNALQQTLNNHRCLEILQIIFEQSLQLAAWDVLHFNHQELLIFINVLELHNIVVFHPLHDFGLIF